MTLNFGWGLNQLSMDQSTTQPLTHHNQAGQTIITEEDIVPESTFINKSFFQRAFGPLLPGAMRGSIFLFLAGSMGSGIFNLPYRVAEMGIVMYTLVLFTATLFSYLGMYLISEIIFKFKVESYSSMSQTAYGPYFKKLAEFCLVIYPWGLTICYQVLTPQFLLQLLADNFDIPLYDGDIGRQNQIYSSLGEWVMIAITLGAISLNLFFILKKEIDTLQTISIIGVIAIFFNILIIVFTLITGFTITIEDDQKSTIEYKYQGIRGIPWGHLQWANFKGWEAFVTQVKSIASIIFCYITHQLVFPLVSQLRNPNQRRVKKVFVRVHLTEFVCNFLAGVTGYLLLVEFIEVLPINPIVLASIQTIPMSIGKLLMVFSLFFSVPLSIFPVREVSYQMFSLQRNNKNHIIISLVLSFGGTLIAILFQKVNSYFGLLGGTAGVWMAGTIPLLCYYKLIGLNTWGQKLIAAFMVLVTVVGMFGAVLSVIYID